MASTTVFATTPLIGIKLSHVGSTPIVAALTKVNGNDGKVYMYVKASEAIGSTATVVIGASGSASTDSGSAGWTSNAAGGAATGEYFWARRTSLA